MSGRTLAWKRTPLTQALGFLPPRLPGPPPPPRTLSSQATVPRGAIGPPQRLRSYSHALTGQGKSWETYSLSVSTQVSTV